MPEIQEVEEQGATPQEVEVRLYAAKNKAQLRRKKLADKAARIVVTSGGVGIILSMAAILFVIVTEVLPLWRSPVAEGENTINLQRKKPLVLGVDEYQEIAYLVTEAGTVDFISLKNSQLLQRYEIRGLRNQRPTAAYRGGIHHAIALGTSGGMVVPLMIHFSATFQNGERTITPGVEEGEPLRLDSDGRPISALIYRKEEGKISAAALFGPRTLVFFAQREKRSLLGPLGVEVHRTDLSATLRADVTTLALDRFQSNLLAGTASGELYHWQIHDPANPRFTGAFAAAHRAGAGITALGWLLGDRSLIVGDTAGGISTWFQVRDPEKPEEAPYCQTHVLRSHNAAVTAIAPSPRDKGFLTADAAGMVLLHHATSEQTLLELPAGGNSLGLLAFAPKANGALAVDTQGQLFRWHIHNPHPEITLQTLFGKCRVP